MTVRSKDLDAFRDTLDGYCGDCLGDLKYIGDLAGASYFWCADCGIEHVVNFGGDR